MKAKTQAKELLGALGTVECFLPKDAQISFTVGQVYHKFVTEDGVVRHLASASSDEPLVSSLGTFDDQED